MTRLFIEDVLKDDSLVVLGKEDSHYISSVLRMRIGEEFMIVGGDGREAVVTVEAADKNSVSVRVHEVCNNNTEPKNFITLYQSVSKGERMDLTIQKAVELGVSRIVPVWSSRCIVKKDAVVGSSSKNERWQKIALEAARQSGRGIVPEVSDGMFFEKALEEASNTCTTVLFPWEEEHGCTLKQAIAGADMSKTAIFIGPEGGFSEEEARKAEDNSAKKVTIGKRILRTETAGPAVLAMILFDTEL